VKAYLLYARLGQYFHIRTLFLPCNLLGRQATRFQCGLDLVNDVMDRTTEGVGGGESREGSRISKSVRFLYFLEFLIHVSDNERWGE